MNNQLNKIWDVIVIGGGPAGMMAAGRAAERDKSVLLLEKNDSLGKKLLITGGGRCNVTNNKPEMESLVSSYRNKPKQLYSLFSQFGVIDTLEFFHTRNMPTKLEAEGRIFPESNTAKSVLNVLKEFINTNKITIQTNSQVISINNENDLFKIKTKTATLTAISVVVATGGTSHPETGSTGDGFKWLKALGHTIIDNSFSLVPVALKDQWIKTVAGLTLQDIRISIYSNGERKDLRRGKLLFTHFGISGPTVLNMSSQIGDLLQYGEVNLEIDLQPDLDLAELRLELNRILEADINKKIKNTLSNLTPSSLVDIILKLAEIDQDKQNNSITKEERTRLLKIIKGIPLHAKGLLGAEKAIVSSGGVEIDEVDFKTMMSRVVPNLFVVGDVLNIDRPSGGYSLQLCWASGYVAGSSC